MRTQEKIQDKVLELKNKKLTVPKFDLLGDNNWELIDAQLTILEGLLLPEDYKPIDDQCSDSQWQTYNVCVETYMWMTNQINKLLINYSI